MSPDAQPLDPAIYERAEKLLPANRSRLVDGGQVRPRWINRGERFWYRVDGPAGHRFVLVDPGSGTREPTDHDRLKALEESVPQKPLEVRSPNGKWAVFRRGHDLCIRLVETDDERPLTSDGVADHGYGVQPDSHAFGVLLGKLGIPHLPPLVAWSPDSRRLLTHRTDQRGVRLQHLVQSAPPDGGRPVLHAYRYAMPGDEVMTRAELLVFDVESGVATAKTEPLLMPSSSPIMFNRAWWAADASAVYYLDAPRDRQTVRLQRLDPLTGESRTLVEERDEPWVDANQVVGASPIGRVLSDDEVLWWSQRDGSGHLYLYDARSGQLQNRVTAGEWVVQQVLHVDLDERVVYFVAAGLVQDDPYRRQVCRVGLDGSGFARLDHDDLDHSVTVPENHAYFIDAASAVDTPPVTSVRGWDGAVIIELEQADVSCLLEAGWTPPERFCVKAADGETDLYGLLYHPPHLDPSQRYPVLDHPYPGPHMARVLPTFEQNPTWDAEAVAALGFVVVALNGRGTPGRNKAFHDLNYRRIGDVGLDDHVAAIRQLAKTRPWMDLDRVGIFGLSRGAGRAVRAMCTYPDFYKVGVAEAGAHDLACYHLDVIEAYDGPDPDIHARSSNLDMADRLEGKLLLIHGEMDDNSHPHQTMRLVDRLIAANKDFDLLIVPGAEHLFIGYESYVRRRRWDFLVRHLLGVEPPRGYRLADTPLDSETFSALLG